MLNADFGLRFFNFAVELVELCQNIFLCLRVEYSLQKLEVTVEN